MTPGLIGIVTKRNSPKVKQVGVELVEWFVFVECTHHVIPILPTQVLVAVSFVAVGFRVADHVQPMPRPFFAVLR